jgi:hypothetical protein
MKTRWWWIAATVGACSIAGGLAYLDVILPPPTGVLRVIIWPADLLLWATGPGPRFAGGGYEWTPVQDFAMWSGAGLSWAFWIMVSCLLWSRIHLSRTQVERPGAPTETTSSSTDIARTEADVDRGARPDGSR